MGNLHLTMACWNYDRTRALQEGRIKPEGIVRANEAETRVHHSRWKPSNNSPQETVPKKVAHGLWSSGRCRA